MDEDYITDELREVANSLAQDGPSAAALVCNRAAQEIDERDSLLSLAHSFLVGEGLYSEFERTLDFEERETYRRFFGLDDDSRDPFADLEDLALLDDEDDDDDIFGEW